MAEKGGRVLPKLAATGYVVCMYDVALSTRGC